MSNSPYLVIVDDDPDDYQVLAEAFTQRNPTVLVKYIRSGPALFEYLAGCPLAHLPGLLVIDYNLPILTAPEILVKLAAGSRYSGITKIVWSTSGRQEYVQKCMPYGITLYLSKPNTIAELDLIINKLTNIIPGQTVPEKILTP